MAFFSRVFLPFLLFVYIATETYLKLQHTSLCGEVGCKLAGELLRFNPLYLNYLGIGAVITLVLLGYLSLKSKLVEKLFFIVLYSAIAFETTIITYQFISNPEPCIFCIGIFSTLLFIALLSYSRRFTGVLAVILSIIFGLNTLAINENKSYAISDGLYLIQSNSCGHCKKVKQYLKEHKIAYTPISIHTANAKSFLKFVNISSIPVAIIKNEKEITLIKGDKGIIAHFNNSTPSKKISTIPTKQLSNIVLSSEIFSIPEEAGCAISITETPTCEDANTSQ